MTLRRLLLAVMASALPWVLSATTGAQTPAKAALAATVSTCTTGLVAADRVAVFTGSMPSVPEAVSMGMRFDLYGRDGDIGPLRRLVVPNFGTWERSVPDVAGFVYDKRVEMLQAPASYRVRVLFHWYDAKAKVIRRTERMSALCRQPDLRPDLRVARLVVVGGAAGQAATYIVRLRNSGATATTVPFATGLSIGGVVQPVQRVGPLAVGELLTVTFEAPRCTPGAVVVATADTGKAVDEADESDNTARKSCPET
jgi:hypothetical protein